MAEPEAENPVLAAMIENAGARVLDVDFIQGLIDQVRAHVVQNAAAYSEAEAQLAEARRLLVEAAEDIIARLPPPEVEQEQDHEEEEEEDEDEDEEEEEAEEEVLLLLVEQDDPEVAARAAAYVERAARVEQLLERHLNLVEAIAFLTVVRAAAFAVTRAPLLPRVLLAIAAAYALAYVASGGRVSPGPASLLRIAVLVLCFLLGRGPCLMLGA